MALGVSDEIIVSYVQQQPRNLWSEEHPQHPNVELVFSEDVAVAEIAHVDAFAVEVPRHLDAYALSLAINRWASTLDDPSIFSGDHGEAVFDATRDMNKWNSPWRVAIDTLWQPVLDWRSREHANAFISDEAYVAEAFLSWYMPDGARHLQSLADQETQAWLAAICQEVSGANAIVSAITNAIAISTVSFGNVNYTGGSISL